MEIEELRRRILHALIETDPISIYFKDAKNEDEYRTEADAILSLLPECTSQSELQEILWKVFRASFGDRIVGSRDRYAEVAAVLWQVVQPGRSA